MNIRINYNILVFLLLSILFILLIGLSRSVEEYNGSSPSLEVCREWSKKYYSKDRRKYESDDEYKRLRQECPVVLNTQMLKDMEKNVVKPKQCIRNYRIKEEPLISNKDMCYRLPNFEYERDYFLQGFDSPIKDGCTTRDNLLYTENKGNIKYKLDKNGNVLCKPISGEWTTSFDNHAKVYTNPTEIEVDHTVPLKHVWDNGGWNWKSWQLKAYANDSTPGHLNLMEKTLNSSKKENSIDTWLPSELNTINCQYSADYAAVKHRWNIPSRDDEFNKLKRYLTTDKYDCERTLPSSPIGNLGHNLQLSELHPNQLAIFGSNTEPNIKYRESIQAVPSYYNYCYSTGNLSTNESSKSTKNLLWNLHLILMNGG